MEKISILYEELKLKAENEVMELEEKLDVIP